MKFINLQKLENARLIYAYVRLNNQHERMLVYITDRTHAISNEACNPQRSKHLQEITTLECKYYLNCYRKLPPLRGNAFFLPPTYYVLTSMTPNVVIEAGTEGKMSLLEKIVQWLTLAQNQHELINNKFCRGRIWLHK